METITEKPTILKSIAFFPDVNNGKDEIKLSIINVNMISNVSQKIELNPIF